MNETFSISAAELSRRRRAPLLNGVIWGAVATGLAFAQLEAIAYALPVGALVGAAMAFVSWRMNRDFLLWAPTHRLVVLDDHLRIVDGAAESHLPYSGVQKMVVNMRRGQPSSIVLVRDNGNRERLPPYDNLALLVELLRKKLSGSRIEERRLVHV
jgi:hypothetical protein